MTSPHVIEVDEQSFESDVIARSAEVPVLVDFWAPWCGPCRFLAPILEKLAGEANGAFVLAKVNTDENQRLSTSYGVSGIPHVALFRDGQIVDQFVGALPEPRIREMLRRAIPSAADGKVAAALERIGAGDEAAARALLDEAIALEPGNVAARLPLARLALSGGRLEEAERLAGSIPASDDAYDAAQAILGVLKLLADASEAGDRAAVDARLAADPDDLEARYALGAFEAAAGRNEAALEHLLRIAKKDKKWRDEAARRAMLVVFGVLGVRHPTSDAFRDELRKIYL